MLGKNSMIRTEPAPGDPLVAAKSRSVKQRLRERYEYCIVIFCNSSLLTRSFCSTSML